jgi:hypothetical protein
MHEGDLAGIGDPAEHAFAKEGSTERDAVQPADQYPVVPGLDAVCRCAGEERRIKPHDLLVDPCIGALFGRLRTAADDVLESGINTDLKPALPHDATQPVRHVETIEG